jgi:microcystin degradation protein MlrC
MRETGFRVAKVVLDKLLSCKLSKAFVKIPILASTLCSRTDIYGPMLRAVQAAQRLEQSGQIVSASVFAGFPLSDVPNAGMSVKNRRFVFDVVFVALLFL